MESSKKKPEGARAGWKLRETATRYETEMFRVREDEVEREDGSRIQYSYLESAEAVIIVPVTENGELVLLKRYRYPVDDWCLEVPAGGMHDPGDLPLIEVAKKELRKEIGATARALRYVDFFYSANTLTDEKCHVFLAEGVTLSKEQATGPGGTLELQLVRIEDAIALARSGAMKTAPGALAVLLCEDRLRDLQPHRATPDNLLET